MPRYRIAIDFTSLDSISPFSGQYRYAVGLVQGLASLRPDAAFLLLGSREEPVPELADVFRRDNDRWTYRWVAQRRFRGAAYLDQARYSWLLLRERVDLLHALHTFVPICTPCPVVVTMYDLMYELFDDYEGARRSRTYRIYKWAVAHKAKRVMCISQTTADDLQRLWGIAGGICDVVPLGTSFEAAKGVYPDVQSRVDREMDPQFLLLSPYNLEPRKNLNALLEAVGLLRSSRVALKLVLFGRAAITPEREEQFELRIRELGITDNVVCTGVLTDSELVALYRRATLFVFPSLYEGFGLPVLEAMSVGACVVARNASAMAEVVGAAGALVETSDPRALASIITNLLGDESLRGTLGRRAYERATLFSMERMARLTYRSYLTALDQEAHGARAQRNVIR